MTKSVFVVGLRQHGLSHGLACARIPGFELAGVCGRSVARRTLPPAL